MEGYNDITTSRVAIFGLADGADIDGMSICQFALMFIFKDSMVGLVCLSDE